MAELQLNTQELQASYGIGLQMGEQLRSQPFDGLDISAVAAGIADAFEGAEAKYLNKIYKKHSNNFCTYASCC